MAEFTEEVRIDAWLLSLYLPVSKIMSLFSVRFNNDQLLVVVASVPL